MPTADARLRAAHALAPRLFALLAALTTLPGSAAASPLLELVGGLGGACGLMARSQPCGAAATYFNPALLGDEPMGLTSGIIMLGSRIGIGVDPRPASADVPNGLGNAYHADGSRWDTYPLATSNLQHGVPADSLHGAVPARPRQGQGSGQETESYESVGLIARLLRNKLALGFYGLLPNTSFTRFKTSYVDEREQYFSNSLSPELYGDRLHSLAMSIAAAYRVDDRWSIGLGTTFNIAAKAFAPTYVEDASKLQDLSLGLDTRVKVGLAPHGGIAYRPIPRLRLTLTAHAPQKLDFNAKFTFLLGSGVEQSSSIRFVLDYMPWRVAGGIAYDVLERKQQTLTLAANTVYGRWSQYTDRHGERPIATYGFSDTLTTAAGARYRRGAVALLADLQYQPTPVPPQTGRTSYADSDRVGGALGVDYGFVLLDTPMHVGVQLLGYRLLLRRQRKLTTPTFADGRNHTPSLVRDEVPDDAVVDGSPVPGREGLQTNNPGWPGFFVSGLIAAASLYLKVQL